MSKLKVAVMTGIATCFVFTAPVIAGSNINAAAADNQAAAKPVALVKNKAGITKDQKRSKKPALFIIKIPEPSNFMMLSLGIAGLIAGRWAAKRRRKNGSD